MQCWAESYCRKAGTEDCNKFCVGYIQLSTLYRLSHMPKKYQRDIKLVAGKDFDSYVILDQFKQNIEYHVQQGHGLYIYSENRGNGKTSWACKIMNHYFRKIALTNTLVCRGLFINTPAFLDELRKKINDEDNAVTQFEADIYTADIVIWDDIGSEKPSEWVRERLYTYINHRESNMLTQIYTSNLSIEELQANLGDRIADRIRGQCKVVYLSEKSRREAAY